MKTYQAAVWAQPGLFSSGPDFDITFGLAHTIEKSAEIYVKVLSMGGGFIRQTIQDDNLRACKRFRCEAERSVFGLIAGLEENVRGK